MKKLFFILFLATAVCACQTQEKTPVGTFSIKGKITNANPTDSLVIRYLGNKPYTIIPIHKDGTYSFTDSMETPLAAFIFIPSRMNAPNAKPLQIFLEPGFVTTVNGDATILANATVYGATASSDYQTVQKLTGKYDAALQKIQDSAETMTARGEDPIIKLKDIYTTTINERKSVLTKFVYAHPKSVVSVFIALTLTQNAEYNTIDSLYTALDSSVLKTYYGEQLKAICGLRSGSALDFSLPTPNNKIIALSSFKGKYVLLDFWASWCGPCRKESPNLVAAFEKYKNKNFTIFSVSLDQDKQAWLDAIAKDKLVWTQVSDLKGWKSSVGELYHITSIPSNFLLDPTGKIISRDLHGEALDKKLAEVLH